MTIDTSGNVDIGTQTWRGGTSNPIAKLNVEVAGGRAINIYNTEENGASLGFVDSQSNGSQYGYISWSSGSGNPMTINNNSNRIFLDGIINLFGPFSIRG